MATYIILERQDNPDLAIEYANDSEAYWALTESLFIDGLCEEDCLDCYTTHEAPEGFEVIIPPKERN